MSGDLRQLVGRTNLDELLPGPPAPAEFDLNQPVAPPLPTTVEPLRSTSDPLQINYATADIAGRLREPGTSGRLRLFALVFLGGPFIVLGLLLLATGWSNPDIGIGRKLLSSIYCLGMIGFWPWLILRRPRR